jgi:hypothetical protein
MYETGVAITLEPPVLIAHTEKVYVTPFGGSAVTKLVALRFEASVLINVDPPLILRRTVYPVIAPPPLFVGASHVSNPLLVAATGVKVRPVGG